MADSPTLLAPLGEPPARDLLVALVRLEAWRAYRQGAIRLMVVWALVFGPLLCWPSPLPRHGLWLVRATWLLTATTAVAAAFLERRCLRVVESRSRR